MTEQQPYLVLRTEPGFELRRYPAHMVAEVTVSAGFDDAGNRAFRYLFGYITGENRSRRKLAMTSPVVQQSAPEAMEMTAPVVQRTADAGSYTVAFVLPAMITAETAPEPVRPEVRVRLVPQSLSAATQYSGRWTQASYQQHCADLLADVSAAGMTPLGEPRFARFDPPYKPWFLRRNEVLIDVADGAAPGGDGAAR
ncbi:hypothetical protein ABIB15_001033 [Marisediminicola sp. UYEF4]|uniref:SOUL family heme-binding protein n=1 Tax=Marisediminicola sp. UYEF4 TaxID=1756384 RepID=UPI003396FEF2